ncbi:succinylglutamate desuccinylase/aspartoacylase family protein [Vibrio navarrensis]|uniref:succinylglutamate desuccinylase/aspartoacylase family protein n=1 Tax=Vibrio navarrensis TaxID=29495 RepID=UPI0013027A1B|nr:succinylglutamate desuccinylase/aspartoacylase family protein [Vibrio navarrensis]
MATQFLADSLQGLRVIDALDVDDLPSGEHKFWFRVASNALSQWQHLPVLVFKGEKPGKKLLITAGVHGDEYNGVLSAQKVARDLVGQSLAGVVTIVPTINLSGLLNHSRDFHSTDPDTSAVNLNRHFPGNAKGNEANRYLNTLWQKLLKPNAQLAIDLHTQTSGAAYPLYVFADFRLQASLDMARWLNPDAILDDPGDAGVLETVWNQHGVPCITVEVGMGRYTQSDLIERTATGINNILTHLQIKDGAPSTPISCLQGKEIISLRAEVGGFVIPQVELLQDVSPGQLLALQYDSFGEEIARYTAPVAATVLSHNLEPMRAPGALVVRLIR